MSFKYVSRENLKQLTGLGSHCAEAIEMYLGEIDRKYGGALTELMMVHTHGPRPVSLPGGLIRVHLFEDEKNKFGFWFDTEHSTRDKYPDSPPIGRYGGVPEYGLMVVREGCENKTLTMLPLSSVLRSAPSRPNSYQLYSHNFLYDENSVQIQNAEYIGITKRGWRSRWAEHVNSAKRGSHYRFHQAIRKWGNSARMSLHTVIAHGLSENSAMEMEEEAVQKTLYPRGLNMIPGGRAGIAYLHKIGAAGRGAKISPDDKHDIINRFFETTSRKGMPNPLIAANWLNPDFAEKIICGPEGRLKPDQIREARFLSSLGTSVVDIADRLQAKNVSQIQRLLDGKTYSRVA